jgi:exodeoxyribonuclease VII, large subunit
MNVDTALLDHPLKVSEVNTLIAETLKTGFYNLALTGEISSFKPSTSGHFYFSLKDEKSKISAVMFKTRQYALSFRPKDGDRVTVYGNIEVYVPYGTYQIVIDRMVREGDGDIMARMEKLKAYYRQKGYFDIDAKRQIPKFPRRIAVVTAATGAAIRDILQITGRRAPGVDIIILPTLVQGEEAPAMIAKRIRQADEFLLGDVIIVGRGGGSQEDLLCFSSPDVVEAIHDSEIPVISAVGHENDYALSDFTADLRASTPSAAAELATAGYKEVSDSLASAVSNTKSLFNTLFLKSKIRVEKASLDSAALRERIAREKLRLRENGNLTALLRGRLNRAELSLAATAENRSEMLYLRLEKAKNLISLSHSERNRCMKEKLSENEKVKAECHLKIRHSLSLIYNASLSRLNTEREKCRALNPYAVLKRGYAILSDSSGKVIRRSDELDPGEIVRATLGEGTLTLKNLGDKT